MHYQFSKSIPIHNVETQCIASPPHTGIASLPHTRNISLSSGSLSRSFIGKGWGEVSMYRMDMTLENANPDARIIKENMQCYHENYYTSAASGVQACSYSKITYQNIYPHIDWVLYIKDNRLEYDFIVRPGGNSADIKIRYDGASQLSTTSSTIAALTPMGQIQEGNLYSYELETGKEVASSYLFDTNVFSFKITKHNDKTIVIDPRLEWATYYGGSGAIDGSETDPSRIIADTSGNLYLTGATESVSNIATTDAFQITYQGNEDAYLAKFSNDGVMEWATYFGGSGRDVGTGIAYAKDGNLLITGQTGSSGNIATIGAYKNYLSGESDAFITKFTADGALLWATYYGGSGADGANGIICDTAGNVYITGITLSSDSIATPGTYKTTYSSGIDVFLAKFNNSGLLVWGTYYGGSGTDDAYDITNDTSGNLYITGVTNSLDGVATPSVYQTTFGGGDLDGFIARFTDSGALVWATYYGGSEQDQPSAIKSDQKGNIYVCGGTYSSNRIATIDAYQPVFSGSSKAFLAKFSEAGDVAWATYYGGNNQDGFEGIDIDNGGNVCMAGTTNSTDSIATAGAYQSHFNGYWDAMVVEFSTMGSLIWGS